WQVLCFAELICAPTPVLEYSRPARRFDDSLDVLEVAVQRLAADRRQAIFGLRPAPLEGLGAGDVAGLLELARVRAEIAVADLEQRLRLVEGQLPVARQRAHDAEAPPLVDQPVESGILGGAGYGGHGEGLRHGMCGMCGARNRLVTPGSGF